MCWVCVYILHTYMGHPGLLEHRKKWDSLLNARFLAQEPGSQKPVQNTQDFTAGKIWVLYRLNPGCMELELGFQIDEQGFL